jgi:hypothetical protein
MTNEIQEVYIAALKELAAQGVYIRNSIKGAKTPTKRKYFTKKAQQNSEKATKLLIKLDRVAPSTSDELEFGNDHEPNTLTR